MTNIEISNYCSSSIPEISRYGVLCTPLIGESGHRPCKGFPGGNSV